MKPCPNCGESIADDEFACRASCWKLLSRSLRTQITSYPHRYGAGVLESRAQTEWSQVPGKRRRQVGA